MNSPEDIARKCAEDIMVDYTNCDTERLAKTCIIQRITAAINTSTEQLQRERDAAMDNSRQLMEILEIDNQSPDTWLNDIRDVIKERDTLKREVELLRRTLNDIATTDYRGNESPERFMARSALARINPPVEGKQ